jgi:hypothetical protein
VVVAWQDNREQPNSPEASDIWFQQFRYSGAILVRVGVNQKLQPPPGCEGTSLSKPKISSANDMFFTAWEGKCPLSHSNIWLARSAPVGVSAVTWDLWRKVNNADSASATNPDLSVYLAWQVSAVGVPFWNPLTMRWEANYTVTREPWVAVAWEEDKGAGTGQDVYATLSVDQGESFEGDQKINDDGMTSPFKRIQDQPVLAFAQEKRDVILVAGGVQVTLVGAPVPALHFAWQDYRNSTGCESAEQGDTCVGNDPDIYYRFCPFASEDNPNHPIGLYSDVCQPSKKLNTNDVFPWQKSAPKQKNPAIAAYNYPTTEDRFFYSDAYVAWADNRNYYDNQDDANYDIFMAIPYADAAPPYLANHNVILNDEAKIHLFDGSVITDRTPDRPPSAWQDMPSIVVNAYHSAKNDDWGTPAVYPNGEETGWLYVAWQDNRDIRSKFYPNQWDVYFTRSNLTYYQNNDTHAFGTSCPETFPCDRYGSGSFISKAFNGGDSAARWYNIWYQSNKDPYAPPPVFQTRVANTITDLLQAPWWPQTSAITKGCEIPLWGYIDSGADIVSGTQRYPQGQYMQYRVNMWTRDPGSGKTPELYWVRAYYDFLGLAGPTPTPGTRVPTAYLPIILRNQSQ